MKKHIINEYRVEVDIPMGFGSYALEAQKDYANDFVSFVKDHRSQDGYFARIIEDSSDVCSFCEREWEEDENGCPVCCGEAVREWEENKKTTEAAK